MTYIGIDIGGTKTLICKLSTEGEIVSRIRFETPHDYQEFTKALADGLQQTDVTDAKGVAIGAPGWIDRNQGVILELGNLPWQHVSICEDVSKLSGLPATVDNDAKVAGLYEATVLGPSYRRVLYVTISTGIGIGLTVDGVIDHSVSDHGGKAMIFEHNGQLMPWEHYASGKAIFAEFGQRASDITDPAIWQEVSRRLVPGFTQLCTLATPDAISIGGGVGAHYDKFKDIFEPLLNSYLPQHTPHPLIVQAKDAEDAVIYGCHVLAKQTYGD